MHNSKYIFLVNSKVRAVLCSYEEDRPNVTTKLTMYKTLDESIAAGDLVIVPSDTRHKHTVVRVKEIGVDPQFDAPDEIRWILGKVDTDAIKQVMASEEQLIHRARQLDVERRRRELAATHLGGAALSDFKDNPLVQLEAPRR